MDVAFWCNVERVLTPLDRIRLKKDDMLIEGLEGPVWWGMESVGCSSARIKVKDEPLSMVGLGRTSGLMKRDFGGW